MAIKYEHLLRQIGVPLLALKGGQVAAAETAYVELDWDSARFPLSFIKDTLANAVGAFALAIAETANHPWRAYLASETADIAHRARIPKEDGQGKPVIGIIGSVYDAADKKPLTEKPLDYIERIVRAKANGALGLGVEYHHFQRVSTVLYHTREKARAEVCVFDQAAERAKMDVAGDDAVMILPDNLAAAVVCETLGLVMQGDEFIAQASQFAVLAKNVKEQIRQGLTSVLNEVPEVVGQ